MQIMGEPFRSDPSIWATLIDRSNEVFLVLDVDSAAILDVNEAGARNLAEKAPTYLDGYSEQFAGVDLAPVRSYLSALRSDPPCVERRAPPTLTHHGETVTLDNLDLEATFLAADALAEAEGDEAMVEQAIEFARADLDAGEEGSRFIALLFDYVREPDARGTVRQRLGEHVDRRAARVNDVDGLFD